jgi:integrase
MKGYVFPRPAKKVMGRNGRERLAPLRPYEEWTNPRTGKTVRAGARGSTWSWRISLGNHAAGKRQNPMKGGFATKKECEEDLAKALADLGKRGAALLVKHEATLLGDYLEDWLDNRGGLKPSSLKGYRDAVRTWLAPRTEKGTYTLVPYLGAILLTDLTHDHLLKLYAFLRRCGGFITKAEWKAARAEGRKPVGKPLGERSIKLAHTVLHMALADAVFAGRLPFSPVERIPKRQLPTYTPQKQAERVWKPEEVRVFLTKRRTDRLYAHWCLALDAGGRRGELAALSWPDLKLTHVDAATVTLQENRVIVGDKVIKGETKTSKPRTLDLDPRTVEALQEWQATQARERRAAGDEWQGGIPGKSGYVFTDEVGEPYYPGWLSDEFLRLQKGLGLPRLVFHGLRHTSATIALLRGVPVHVVSERLGHADVSTTLNIYAHVIRTQASDAARAIGSAIYEDPPVDEPTDPTVDVRTRLLTLAGSDTLRQLGAGSTDTDVEQVLRLVLEIADDARRAA